MYRNILVPLDGSAFGEHALPLAVSLARRAGATLRLVHVHSPLAAVYAEAAVAYDTSLEMELKQRARTYLEGTAERVRAAAEVPAYSILLEGPVAPSVRTAVAGTEAELVVMTTHGRGPLARFWLGSVADELVRECPVPLLLVHPAEEPADLGQDRVLRHILLPLDGSPLAEQMLEPAIALGSLMEAEYTLLRVIKPVLPAPHEAVGATMNVRVQAMLDEIEQLQHTIRRDAQSYLDAVAQRLRERSLRVHVSVAVERQPAVAILHEKGPPKVEAIALETHGRRGLSRLFLGSVADKVIRGASVPVLVHRPLYT
jgi:nucleotide-binding universal stress UspA family protein